MKEIYAWLQQNIEVVSVVTDIVLATLVTVLITKVFRHSEIIFENRPYLSAAVYTNDINLSGQKRPYNRTLYLSADYERIQDAIANGSSEYDSIGDKFIFLRVLNITSASNILALDFNLQIFANEEVTARLHYRLNSIGVNDHYYFIPPTKTENGQYSYDDIRTIKAKITYQSVAGEKTSYLYYYNYERNKQNGIERDESCASVEARSLEDWEIIKNEVERIKSIEQLERYFSTISKAVYMKKEDYSDVIIHNNKLLRLLKRLLPPHGYRYRRGQEHSRLCRLPSVHAYIGKIGRKTTFRIAIPQENRPFWHVDLEKKAQSRTTQDEIGSAAHSTIDCTQHRERLCFRYRRRCRGRGSRVQ